VNGNERNQQSRALKLVRKLVDYGIDGVGPLCPAGQLADQYLNDPAYSSLDERVDALIRWEASKNFGAGFIAGLGGIVVLPVAIPAALGASWIIQARMCGAIAAMYGYDLRSDRVRTLILLSLLGDAGKEILKETGVRLGKRIGLALIDRIPGRVLIEINKRVGFRLLTKAGERGIVNLAKLVPGLGGLMGGGFDAATCIAVGRIAKASFRPGGRSSAPVESTRRRPAAHSARTRPRGRVRRAAEHGRRAVTSHTRVPPQRGSTAAN
jgi:hypothetical protein